MVPLVQIPPGADDGEGLGGVGRGFPAPGHRQRPQGGVLLAEVVSQVQGDGVSYAETVCLQEVHIHHAHGPACVSGSDEAPLLADHPVLRHPALGGHVVPVHDIEGMQILIGHVDELRQGGVFLGLQIVFRGVGDVREVGPPILDAVVPHHEFVEREAIGILTFLVQLRVGENGAAVAVSQDEDVPSPGLDEVRLPLIDHVVHILHIPVSVAIVRPAVPDELVPAVLRIGDEGHSILRVVLLFHDVPEPGRVPRQELYVLQGDVLIVCDPVLVDQLGRPQQVGDIAVLHRGLQDATARVGVIVLVRIQAKVLLGDPRGQIPLLHPGNMGQGGKLLHELLAQALLVVHLIDEGHTVEHGLAVGIRPAGLVRQEEEVENAGIIPNRALLHREHPLVFIPGLPVLPVRDAVF